MTPDSLFADPNGLAHEYSRFRVADRLLLTGHSHQAWPDCGFVGQQRAWEAAAEFVDEKWDEAFERAERVKRGWAGLLGDPGSPDDGDYALGSNTHELVVRFLSALPLRERPRLVTTDGEFHSIRRQLARLAEEGIAIVRVPRDPVDTLSARIADEIDDSVAAALVSCVLFRDARIVPDLSIIQSRCSQTGAELLVDTYHALNVIPFSLAAEGLGDAFVTGGGYKYVQLGEGNCFLRVPPGSTHRPVVTGWFSEFSTLEDSHDPDRVLYGSGAARFAGSTYDPTSHYRAAEVFDFFATRGLSPEFLRHVSQHQVTRLEDGFRALDLDPALISREEVPIGETGGFLALTSPRAGDIRVGLRERGVLTDHRHDVLRLGPAPYLSDRQLDDAIHALGETVRAIG